MGYRLYSYDDGYGGTSLVCADSISEAREVISHRCMSPSDIQFREEKDILSWDDIYCLANNTGYGDDNLTAKDTARYQVGNLIFELTGKDIEECECPEEEIDSFIDDHPVWFDICGNIVKK